MYYGYSFLIKFLPRQEDFRNFCMCDDTEKVCQKLEEIFGIS